MNNYDVTIRAIVTKTYRVSAKDQDNAIELANEMFSVLNDDTDEDYQQDVLNIDELEVSK
jgi:hypothetical protein